MYIVVAFAMYISSLQVKVQIKYPTNTRYYLDAP
jgi:hypothetical protein